MEEAKAEERRNFFKRKDDSLILLLAAFEDMKVKRENYAVTLRRQKLDDKLNKRRKMNSNISKGHM